MVFLVAAILHRVATGACAVVALIEYVANGSVLVKAIPTGLQYEHA